jgi:hypothetical protein
MVKQINKIIRPPPELFFKQSEDVEKSKIKGVRGKT